MSADMFSQSKRSEIMSRIRSKGTRAEKIVFSYLRQEKVYFQKHYKRVPGKPDIALPRKKKAVFIDGDFWHGRTYERVIKNRKADDYWVLKIARNMERDREQEILLLEKCWRYIRVWEKEIITKRTRVETLERIKDFLLLE